MKYLNFESSLHIFVIFLMSMILNCSCQTLNQGFYDNKTIDCQLAEDISLLNQVILENRLSDVQTMIKCGADINKSAEDGTFPLEWTLIMSNRQALKLLLENGADPFVVTKEGETFYAKATKPDVPFYFRNLLNKFRP